MVNWLFWVFGVGNRYEIEEWREDFRAEQEARIERDRPVIAAQAEAKQKQEAKAAQKEYKFTVLLEGVHEITRDMEEKLASWGCKDALVYYKPEGFGKVFLQFRRRADTCVDAVRSAKEDVKDAGYDCTVVGV